MLFFMLMYQAALGQKGIPAPADFVGMQVTRNDVFNGSGLWGYIDGGADIYLEYGFEKVHVLEVVKDSAKYRIDIYEMNKPEAAFGIFSIHLYNAPYTDSVYWGYARTPYQVQMHYGRYYVSIVLDKKGEENSRTAEELRILIQKHLPFTPFIPPGVLTCDSLLHRRSTLKYICGQIGIQNNLPEWEDYFDGINSFSFFWISIPRGEKEEMLSEIKFGSLEDKSRFFANISGADYKSRDFSGTVRGNLLKAVVQENGKVLFSVSR